MRYADWPERLNRIVEGNLNRPFEWGNWDCCLFAAECVEAMTGDDPMGEFRGRYSSAEGARALLRAHPSKSLFNLMRRKFGNPSNFARRGDIVYTITEDGPSLGVCVGACAVFLSEEGIVSLPIQGMRSFRCG